MPYDPEQAARQRAEQRAVEAESTARAKGALKSPLPSSGGGGFTTGAPKRAAPRPNTEPWNPPSKPTSATELGGALDQGGPAKSYGIDSGDQDASGHHAYLGHFANDDVLRQGHNVGHKPKGKATSTGIAKRGFRKLGGSASGIQGSSRYGQPDGESLGLRPSRPDRERREKFEKQMAANAVRMPREADPAPRAVADVKLSRRHHLDAAARDLKHETDHRASRKKHLAAAKVRTKQLKRR